MQTSRRSRRSRLIAVASVSLAVCAVPLTTSAATAATSSWTTIATIEGAKHQACKVLANDGTAWRVKNRLVNGDQARAGASMTVLRNGKPTDRTWDSGLIAKNTTSPVGSVLMPKGDSRFTLEHTEYVSQAGGGGTIGIGAISRC